MRHTQQPRPADVGVLFGGKKAKKDEPEKPATQEKEPEYGTVEIRKIKVGYTTQDLIEIEDGFSTPDGTPNTSMPSMRMTFTFEATATGSRFTGVTRFTSLESMEQLVKMGMIDGLRSAMGQLDAVLGLAGGTVASITGPWAYTQHGVGGLAVLSIAATLAAIALAWRVRETG